MYYVSSTFGSDTSPLGYCLERPEARSPLPSAELKLNAAACSIVRAIMHSTFIFVSCNSMTATEPLLKLVKLEDIQPNEFPEFFWSQLEKDIEILAQAIGKTKDEAAIVLHLVLQKILTCEPPNGKFQDVLITVYSRKSALL